MSFGLTLVLALVTFGVVIAVALWSKGRTEKRQHSPYAPKSTLATDGPGPNAVIASRNQRKGIL